MIIDSYNFSETDVNKILDLYLSQKDSGAVSVEWSLPAVTFSLFSFCRKPPKWHATIFYPSKIQPENKSKSRVLFVWANPDTATK